MADFQCKSLNKEGEPCGSPFRSTINPEYCAAHDPERQELWEETRRTGGENRARTRSRCALDGCSKALPKSRAKWCSDAHSQLGNQRIQAQRKRLKAGKEPIKKQLRKPRPWFFVEGWDKMVDSDGSPSNAVRRDCAQRGDVDLSTVTRWYNWVAQQRWDSRGDDEWSPPPREFPDDHWRLGLDHLGALVADFLWFRETFIATKRGKPFWTPEFQLNWVRAVLTALITGGRLVILSPVRHGKTELMIHFCVWLICRFPRINILWIGGTERIAQKSVAHIMRILTNNKALVGAFTRGGFRPEASESLPWSRSEFTVSRTLRGTDDKGSTMQAIGRGGTTASLDADIAIGDDIEDHGATVQPGMRENTRDWWTSDFESRKEEHTALFLIGSRSHPDDLAGHLLENDQYESIVETAHDPVCEIPEDDPGRYAEHVDCMLFPELRSFRWLMQQKQAAEAAGGVARFNMVYLGKVTGKGMTIFVASEIAACRDRNYRRDPHTGLGTIPKPIIEPGDNPDDVGGVSLVGGLDPSGSGYQASFLWAYQVKPELHMWMVDTENHEGGGIAQARRTIQAWHDSYGLSHWVVEENLYQGGIQEDEILLEMRTRLGIVVEPHHTGVNKWDPQLGVSTLQPLFAEKQIILPYGDPESIAKSDAYQRQLVHFSDATRNRNTRAGYKSDLVMASWFPMVVIRRMRMEHAAEIGVQYRQSFRSYRGSNWSTAPWTKKRSLAS